MPAARPDTSAAAEGQDQHGGDGDAAQQ